MVTLLSLFVGCAYGYGVALYLVSTLLKKNNDIGGEDIKPEVYAKAPKYDVKIRCSDRSDCVMSTYSSLKQLPQYADPDPNEEVHAIRTSDKPSIVYKKKDPAKNAPKILQDQYDIDGDLPEVDIPLFKPKD